MVKWAFMTDPTTNNIGLYDEPVATGAFDDPNSARNAPLNDPENNLASVYWHIQFDNMAVGIDSSVTINHLSVPAGATNGNSTNKFDYAFTITDWVLATHSYGYEPIAYVAIGDNLITPGYIIQRDVGSPGAARYATIWSDTSKVYLREFASRGYVGMAAQSITYDVLVMKEQPPAAGNIPPQLIDFDPLTGIVTMGDGRWVSTERYLQVVPGGSPYALAMDKTLDANNGSPRFVNQSGTVYDPVPSSLATGYSTSRFPFVAGNGLDYQGSFAGGTSILVQAP